MKVCVNIGYMQTGSYMSKVLHQAFGGVHFSLVKYIFACPLLNVFAFFYSLHQPLGDFKWDFSA